MIINIERAWHERITTGYGRVCLIAVEQHDFGTYFGEVASSKGKRSPPRRRRIVLNVTNNIPDFTGLMPGELELILPVVTRLLDDLSREAEARSTHEEAEANQEG